jgi:hypothetical protein
MTAALVSLAMVAAPALAATAPDPAAAPDPVYVLSARGLSAKPGDDGDFVVRLQYPTRQVTSFVAAGHTPVINVTVQELSAKWEALGFDQRPPLAAIDPGGDHRKATLVRLGQPRLSDDGESLTLSAKATDAAAPRLAEWLESPADAIPTRAGATTVAIDANGGDPGALREIADPLDPNSKGGLWVKVSFYLDAIPSTVDKDKFCTADYGIGQGSCRGFFRTLIPGSRSDHGSVRWQDDGPPRGLGLEFFGGAPGADMDSGIGGWAPSRASNAFTVTAGWLGDPGNRVYSGTDTSLTDAPGGPLDLNASFDPNDGYVYDVYGYVWAEHGL